MDLDVHLPGIAAGDPAAFGRWVAGAEPRLRGSLAGFAAQVDCEAVLQEGLLRVWQVAPRHRADGRPDGLLRLAVRICRNLAIDEVRRTRPGRVDPAEAEAALAAASIEEAARDAPDPLLRRIIAECRDQLRGKPADALAARLASGGTEPDEVLAGRLGMRTNTFLQNFTRARRALADCLERRRVKLDVELS